MRANYLGLQGPLFLAQTLCNDVSLGSREVQKHFLQGWIFVSKIHSLHRQQTPLCKPSKEEGNGATNIKNNLGMRSSACTPSPHLSVFQVEEGGWSEVGRTW